MPDPLDARALERARMALCGQLREHFHTPLGELEVETLRRALRKAFTVYFLVRQDEEGDDDD